MRMTPERLHGLVAKLLRGAGFGVLAGAVALAAGLTPLARTLELKLYDWRVQRTAVSRAGEPAAGGGEAQAASSGRIVLVTIDDDSLRRMEPLVGRWPWPRMVHAALIDFLAAGGARAIVYDVLFAEADRRRFTVGDEEWTGEESDQALVDATARAGTVIHTAEAASSALLDPSRAITHPLHQIPSLAVRFSVDACVERRPQLTPPFPALASAARAIGHSLTVLDADGPIRRAVPFVTVAGSGESAHVVPSLSLAAVALTQGLTLDEVSVRGETLRIGSVRVPLVTELVPDYYGPATPACRAMIAWRGPTLGPDGSPAFQSYSFYDLFYAQQQAIEGVSPDVPPATFRDRVVVVGVTAQGLHDVFTTPFAEGRMPGPEVHANIIDAWLSGRTLTPVAQRTGVATAFGLALAVGLAGAAGTVWLSGLVAAALAGGYTLLNVRFFASGDWWPLVVPVGAVVLAFVADLGWQYVVEGREKRKVKRLFSRYVAKDVYEQLLADPSRAALGGSRRTMTVLFSDVRGFTALTEKGAPEDIVAMLNEYFTRMVQVLFEHRGTLDKFVGDMVMALFGAPLDDEDHAEHAVQAALAMARSLEVLNAEWASFGLPTLDIGIGINTGEMVAGNIGSTAIMSYTVIGDAVNLGARLESLNKEYGTRIIISEATRGRLKGQYDIRPLGSVTVKGKSQPVAIFEVKTS
jgi:adenylate cyclase